MYSKRYEKDGTVLVAACDEKLIGKTLEQGDISFEVKASFYGEEKVTGEALAKLLKGCDIANLVGEETVRVAKALGLVKDEAILMIGKVPHIQIMVI